MQPHANRAPALGRTIVLSTLIRRLQAPGTTSEMGIKFSCPNGHKLNVKTFLAGKRAICPKCGARVMVPEVSESEQPGGSPTDSTLTTSATIEIAVDEIAAQLQASPPTPTAETGSQKPAPTDAIAEAPGAVWYVRPATGGQFGPASADVMRSWLDDGRVSGTSLVWRAGWADWQSAATVFPQLAPALGPPSIAPATSVGGMPVLPTINAASGTTPAAGSLPQGYVVQTIPLPVIPATAETTSPPREGMSPLSSSVRRRRRQRDMRLYASGILAVVSVILMIVLFFVFRRGEQPSSAETAPAADSSTN
jgi:hypothetical protein